jgi:hypothetical protein
MKPTDDTPEDVGALIRSTVAGVEAPASLRARVEALGAPRRRPLRGLGLAAAGAAAALAVVLVLVLGGSSAGGPSLADAAAAALRPATGPAPAPDQFRPALLTAAIDGLSFPRWDEAFALEATGERREKIAGRGALTVAYADRAGAQVGYTILAGPRIDLPEGTRKVVRKGTPLWVYSRGGATVVTWFRAGHTCVVASRSMGAERLERLAAWTGGGVVGGYNR